MKRTIIHTLAAMAALVLVSACSQDDNSLVMNTDSAQTFSITVADGGYAPTAGEKSGTRATENSYTTQFTAGDNIGVYAVKDGAVVTDVNNLCLVATDDDKGGITWKTTEGKNPLYIPDAIYYAYYPWQSATYMADKVTVPASEANTFFNPLISGWSPGTKQTTYSEYTASDLMIANSTPSGKTLSFSMQHCMALVVIALPYKTNADGTPLPASDTKFNDFTPCWMSSTGTYRYLIRPATTQTLSGSYTNATPATVEWQFSANVSAGQYKKYTVDNAIIIPM